MVDQKFRKTSRQVLIQCSNQEKRPEFENNRYCSVLLFLIVSCLVGTKTINASINVKQ